MDASGSIAATIEEIEPLACRTRRYRHPGPASADPRRLRSSLGRASSAPAFGACPARPVLPDAAWWSRPPGVAKRAELAAQHCPLRVRACPPTSSNCPRVSARSSWRSRRNCLPEAGTTCESSVQIPLIAVGDDVLLEAATFAAAVYLRGLPLVTIPVTTLGSDRHVHRREGRHRPARSVGRNLLGRHPPAQGSRSSISTWFKTSRSPNGAQPWPRSSSTASSATRVLLSLLEVGRAPGGRRGVAGADWSCSRSSSAVRLAKRRLVLSDERDTRRRTGLHSTSGIRSAVRLQAATGYRIRHGEAVAYGLRAALHIGVSLGVTPTATANRATRLIRRFDLGQDRLDVSDRRRSSSYIESDKKRRKGKPRWVLVATEGVTIRDDVPAATVRSAVARALAGVPAREAELGRAPSAVTTVEAYRGTRSLTPGARTQAAPSRDRSTRFDLNADSG